MAVWISVLWKIHIQTAKKWPEMLVHLPFMSQIHFESDYRYYRNDLRYNQQGKKMSLTSFILGVISSLWFWNLVTENIKKYSIKTMPRLIYSMNLLFAVLVAIGTMRFRTQQTASTCFIKLKIISCAIDILTSNIAISWHTTPAPLAASRTSTSGCTRAPFSPTTPFRIF